MLNRYYQNIIILAIILLLTGSGCGIRKSHTERIQDNSRTPIKDSFVQFQKGKKERLPFRANGSCTFTNLKRGESITSGLVLFVSPKEGLSFMIRPFPFVEAGNLYLDRKGGLILDRINKKYIQANFSTLFPIGKKAVNYDMLESLLLGYYINVEGDVKRKYTTTQAIEECKDLNLKISYTISPPHSHPTLIEILELENKSKETDYAIRIEYDEFREESLPSKCKVTFLHQKEAIYALSIVLKTIRTEEQIKKRITPPSLEEYQSIPLNFFLHLER